MVGHKAWVNTCRMIHIHIDMVYTDDVINSQWHHEAIAKAQRNMAAISTTRELNVALGDFSDSKNGIPLALGRVSNTSIYL